MSKAFTREDVDPPERSGRKRSASGLPPGAVNYITPRGAKRLRDELTKAEASGGNRERVAELKSILASITIVDSPSDPTKDIGFGSTITVREDDGTERAFTVAGVDELSFEPNGISWISPLGKALLAADLGDRVSLESGRTGKIVSVSYRAG